MRQKPSSRKIRALAVAASVGFLFALLLALEVFVRTHYRSEVDTASLLAKPQAASIVPFVSRVPDPELLYDLKPGTRVLGWGGVRVETDPSGCCRVVPGRPLDSGEGVRIAILGDSSPFGWKVPFEETYGERLRPLLERSRSGPAAIRNFAVPGYNSQQNRVALRDKALSWRPDLIVLHYDHNDSEPVDDSRTAFMSPEFGDNALHSMLIKLLRRRVRLLRPARRTVAVPDDPGHPERMLHDYRYAGPQFEHHMSEMKAIAELAASRKIPVVVFLWNPWLTPSKKPESDPFYALLHKPVAERLKGMGFRVADSYGLYQGWMTREKRNDLRALWAGPEDAHPNAEGHRLIANYLAGEIAALLSENARSKFLLR